MTKLLSARVVGILLMITAIFMALIHWSVSNLQTLSVQLGWSEQMAGQFNVTAGTLNQILTMQSFISGISLTTQWAVAYVVVIAIFLTGLLMLWKPKLASIIAIVLLALQLFLQITTYNSVILGYASANQISVWELMVMPYVADLNLVLLMVIASTTALLCGSIWVFYKSRKMDFW